MTSISEQFKSIEESIPKNVALVAVSKTKPVSDIQTIYELGHRVFGENKVQELVDKYESLPKDIQWHMIGHLQRNKVKYIAPFVSLIHGVDSLKLLKEIEKQGSKIDRPINVLLQFHIAEEESKFGFDLDEARTALESEDFAEFKYVNVVGVMGMATFTKDERQIRKEFKQLKAYFENLKKNYFASKKDFEVISMGMSGDYQLAIEEGSTMVRVGSSIFGERNYA
jgi:hypothetical protein